MVKVIAAIPGEDAANEKLAELLDAGYSIASCVGLSGGRGWAGLVVWTLVKAPPDTGHVYKLGDGMAPSAVGTHLTAGARVLYHVQSPQERN